jgi:hypothetical protein
MQETNSSRRGLIVFNGVVGRHTGAGLNEVPFDSGN